MQAWLPSPSPAFLAERQAVSPASQILPAARGPLDRRRPVQPSRRRHGGSGSGGGGGGGRGGGWKAAASAGTAETSASEGPTAGRGPSDNTGAVGSSHPRSQGQYSRDDEGRLARTQGARGGGSGGGGAGARGRGGCGEAWGLSAVALARCSDRTHSSGAGSSRGSKSSSTSDVWAWSGAGGGTARGKAMLSAYGLQTGKHNPTCPRGTPGDGSARLGRWYRGQSGGGAENGAGGAGGGKADAEEVHEKCGSAESGGIGEYRGSVCGDSKRCGGNASDRAACGHTGQRFRASKARKHRPSVGTLSKSHAAARRSGDHIGGTPSGGRGHGVWDTTAEGASGGKCSEKTLPHTTTTEASRDDDVSVATTAPTVPTPRTTETPDSQELPEDGHRPADHIWRALEDLLVPPRGATSHGSSASTFVPHQSGCCAPGVAAAAAAAAAATSGQVAVLTMDGRGGSAAPPHRPSQLVLRAPASAFYSPVLPDLAGTESGAGVLPCEADSSCGQASGEGGGSVGGGGDDHSTPPVSRQRAHSHHSPWQARKHPRGFMGGRGGAGFGRCHHYHQERSLAGERNTGLLGENTSACLSPSSSLEPGASQIADGNYVATAAAAGLEHAVPRCAAAPPIALARPPAEIDADEDASCDRQRSSDDHCFAAVASTSKKNRAAGANKSPAATASATTAAAAAVVGVLASTQEVSFFGEGGAAVGRKTDGLDPFDGLANDTVVVSPQSQLIDHYKLAPRPTSRRGSRNQGAEGDAVKPAFCLFSGHRDDRASGARAAGERRSKSREDGRRGQVQR